MIYLTYDCLIVEDEKPLAENTCKYLNLSGIRSEAVFNVEGYYEFMDANTARMILLDINLGMDVDTIYAVSYTHLTLPTK